MPPARQPISLACRTLSREIPKGWGIASFSSLIAGRSREAELPDRDSLWGRRDEEAEPLLQHPRIRTFLEFPRGRRAGTALHELFEAVDFSLQPIEPARQLVREKLAQFGFEAAWQEPVLQMLRTAFSYLLIQTKRSSVFHHCVRHGGCTSLSLAFPLDLLTSKRLRAAFAVHRSLEFPTALPEALEQLDFVPVRGAMKGFIDLVFEQEGRFYLADWKSNFLGPDLEAYGQAALREAMIRELYVLQYHLYAVALDRYLTFRIPEYQYNTHFGGVYYLFLRGISPQQGSEYGVFSRSAFGSPDSRAESVFTCGEVETKVKQGVLRNRPRSSRPRTKAEDDDEHEDEDSIGRFVIPAKAGIQFDRILDSGFRRNDGQLLAMTTETTLNQLDRFTDIDRHFADFLLRLEGREDRVYGWRRLLPAMQRSLGMSASIWERSQESPFPEQEDQTALSTCAPDLSDWVSVLKQSTVVGSPGRISTAGAGSCKPPLSLPILEIRAASCRSFSEALQHRDLQ